MKGFQSPLSGAALQASLREDEGVDHYRATGGEVGGPQCTGDGAEVGGAC